MRQHNATTVFGLAASLLTVMLIIGAMLPAAGAANQAAGRAFAGQVVSASGAMFVGGAATNPGHPVAGATVYLVPTTAIDVTTRMTASAIYAAPFPAEAYDEPLEDAIRLQGAGFPKSTTDARGNFVVASVPDGKFFVHVTPGPTDTEHLPGGDQSRQSRSAEQLRGQSMTIKVSSSPSAAARYAGSSSCLACHKNKEHWQQTGAQARMDRSGSPGSDAGLFETHRLL